MPLPGAQRPEATWEAIQCPQFHDHSVLFIPFHFFFFRGMEGIKIKQFSQKELPLR